MNIQNNEYPDMIWEYEFIQILAYTQICICIQIYIQQKCMPCDICLVIYLCKYV